MTTFGRHVALGLGSRAEDYYSLARLPTSRTRPQSRSTTSATCSESYKSQSVLQDGGRHDARGAHESCEQTRGSLGRQARDAGASEPRDPSYRCGDQDPGLAQRELRTLTGSRQEKSRRRQEKKRAQESGQESRSRSEDEERDVDALLLHIGLGDGRAERLNAESRRHHKNMHRSRDS